VTDDLLTGNRQPATGNRQPATGNRQPATGNRQPATGNRQPATYIEIHVISFNEETIGVPRVTEGDA
jgi:hypothetical protein